MNHILPLVTASLLLAASSSAYAQATTPTPDRENTGTRARAEMKRAAADTDITYGRVKEFTAGQKVVIDVDNAPDKEFDLKDKGVAVKLGKGLKVGDPVKVTEHDVAGKTKSVTIAKHTGGGVAHGDKDPAAKKP